jgi:hypothetical protein
MLTAESLGIFDGDGLGIYVDEMQRSLTGLGDVPTDFEAARARCYTPVWQGWYYGVPVNPSLQGSGLGNSTLAQEAVNGSNGAQRAVQELAKIEKKALILSAIASLSVATMAVFTIVQGVRGAKRC